MLIIYPPFDPREEIRTLRKLKKEMQHFPSDRPALIVIESQSLMILVDDKMQRLRKLREAFRGWMLEQKNLVGVVITVRFLAPQKSRISECEGDFLIENSIGLTGLDHIVLFNPALETSMPSELRNIVKAAFLKDFVCSQNSSLSCPQTLIYSH